MNKWRKYCFLVILAWMLLETLVILNYEYFGQPLTVVLGVVVWLAYIFAQSVIFRYEDRQLKQREGEKS